ncbi:MAG: hypothetical protein ACOCVN_01625, partial [bacterium]
MNDLTFHNEHYQLPDSIRAKNHNNVKCLLQVYRRNEEVGEYTDGKIGYLIHLEYRIIDYEREIVVFKEEVVGDAPSRTKSHSGLEHFHFSKTSS